jgi:hypothetical protein
MILPRFRLRTLMIAVVVVAMAFWGAVSCWRLINTYVAVVVINKTGEDIFDVLISYEGGERRATQIRPGGESAWRIRARGESDIVLLYRDANGKLIRKADNAYFESGYRGSIYFYIRQKGVQADNPIYIGIL